MEQRTRAVDVVIVGGGLAGLTAATYAARRGRRVALFDKAQHVGGRAITSEKSGFRFNLGPHALYRGGRGAKILSELGIEVSGGQPKVSGAYAIDGGAKHTLPGGLVSLLTTGLLSLPAKLETARFLSSFAKVDAQPLQAASVREWLDTAVRNVELRRLVQALLRLSTYANDPARQSAGAAVAQLQMALSSSVTYIDGGWQVLVDGLREAAQQAGVGIATSEKVVAVECGDAVRGVRLAGGEICTARAVIVAAGPDDVRALVPEDRNAEVRAWAAGAVPVRAACLDVGLSYLPRPHATFALGIDRPLYLSVHSAVARLAPEGGAAIHVAKYLEPDVKADPRADERELEEALDLIQPGWRERVVERRFFPSLTVASSMPTAAAGGMAGRPGPAVAGVRNLYVAGDWVGPEGMLADASLASARRAAELAAAGIEVRAAAA